MLQAEVVSLRPNKCARHRLRYWHAGRYLGWGGPWWASVRFWKVWNAQRMGAGRDLPQTAQRLSVHHDPEADAVSVTVRGGCSVSTRLVDERRLLDFDVAGHLLGIEFLDVSAGIRLMGLGLAARGVDAAALAALLRAKGLPVLDDIHVTGAATLPQTVTEAPVASVAFPEWSTRGA